MQKLCVISGSDSRVAEVSFRFGCEAVSLGVQFGRFETNTFL
jgi:hypothetical protein